MIQKTHGSQAKQKTRDLDGPEDPPVHRLDQNQTGLAGTSKYSLLIVTILRMLKVHKKKQQEPGLSIVFYKLIQYIIV